VSCISASISRRFRLISLSCCAICPGAVFVVGDQAFDPERHVFQAAGGVQARAQREAEVEGRGAARFAASHAEQRGDAGMHAAGAHALQALRHQDAVVGVELDHVGHRAQRDQVEQRVQLRLVGGVEHAAAAQFGAQGQQHVEHDAHAGQVLAREAAGGLVRIHDHARARQRVAGQVVVGDHDLDAAFARRLDAVDAGDAVVHGDDDVGRFFARGQGDDFRRQAVAVFEAVRHDVVDARAHRAQAAQRGGAGGGAVAVVVGDDGHLLAGGWRRPGRRLRRRSAAGRRAAAGPAAR
jgi:hypothetical protein